MEITRKCLVVLLMAAMPFTAFAQSDAIADVYAKAKQDAQGSLIQALMDAGVSAADAVATIAKDDPNAAVAAAQAAIALAPGEAAAITAAAVKAAPQHAEAIVTAAVKAQPSQAVAIAQAAAKASPENSAVITSAAILAAPRGMTSDIIIGVTEVVLAFSATEDPGGLIAQSFDNDGESIRALAAAAQETTSNVVSYSTQDNVLQQPASPN